MTPHPPAPPPRIDLKARPSGWGRSGHLVVVPARNEAARIAACLGALEGQGADLLVVANNCTDATAQIAASQGAAVLDCHIATGGVGAARRLGIAEGMRMAAETGADLRAVLTSDADCLVAPDWLDANLRHLGAGAAAVCGWVLPIAEEHALLPPLLLHRAALEDRFLDLKVALELRLMGRAGHERTPGASLAFQLDAYVAAGGFDPAPAHEDRAIILRLKALGLPVVHARDVIVHASCRLDGRAPDGMAAALRERAADPDAPLCPDLGRSEIASVAAVLATLPPLRLTADLPGAIAQLERLLSGTLGPGQAGKGASPRNARPWKAANAPLSCPPEEQGRAAPRLGHGI
ncbi:glycosyltransferase family 2 protein [Paracoccus sp. (in: a-proteobacteria)]|uniref:glycosyltransferase n=1 Tax=Paracoccus sp. TaxID=267 RepID=UPI0026E02C75|nr:glycosyltransferase [Paracoccus sp. (in: a-proteobacteria)]MDO5371523.1 glycosyltransferase [Paracoccus sp. (in: a-proteobacteria)]